MPYLGETLALLAPLSWSVAVILFKRTEGVAPLGLNLFKNTVGLAMLTVTLLALRIPWPADRSVADWLRVVGSGVLGLTLADTLMFAGLQRIGAARFALVDTAYAPILVALSWALMGEVPTAVTLAGGALTVAGVAVATIDPRAVRAERGREVGLGLLMALGAVAGTAVGVMLARPVLVHASLLEVTWTRLASGVLTLALGLAAQGSLGRTAAVFRPGPHWRTLVPAAFFGTYVALLLWLGGYKWAPAAVAAVLNQMATVYMLIGARVVLGEAIAPRQVLGSAMAISGALWIVWSRA